MTTHRDHLETYFQEFAEGVGRELQHGEEYTCTFFAENTAFTRFNKGRVRQAGVVDQATVHLDLIRGRRHIRADVALSFDANEDKGRLRGMVSRMRAELASLPEDPHLLVAREVNPSRYAGAELENDPLDVVDAVLEHVADLDFVGILALGPVCAGFANSFGQRNWFSRASFQLDYSLYGERGAAVKRNYAGTEWSSQEFANSLSSACKDLQMLRVAPVSVPPGKCRVFFAPSAVRELLSTVSWGGFGEQDFRTKRSCLSRMREEAISLHPSVTLTENTELGTAPPFQAAGFVRPPCVKLIHEGRMRETLISPRTAKEYGLESNGAAESEEPDSLDMQPGNLLSNDVLPTVRDGLYISNLWYLNYSDRPAGRITGMTRFATFLVRAGSIVAPVSPMRFDETIYHMFGKGLVALTQEREFQLESDTYERRSTRSYRMPGMLVDDVSFTL